MASSMSNLHDSDFRGLGSGFLGTTATVVAGGTPSRPSSRASQLQAARSEVNLRSAYLTNNISSTSLAAPPPTSKLGLGEFNSSTTSLDLPAPAQRPRTAHSMRNLSKGSGNHHSISSNSISLSRKTSLDISQVIVSTEISTPTFGTGSGAPPPKSPLGQFELESPIKSDTASSFFGDDEPEKIAQEITSRITREEEMAKAKLVDEERRKVQAELETQRRRYLEASRPTVTMTPPTATMTNHGAYPSPPLSIESEGEKPGVFMSGPKSSPRVPGGPFPQQDRRPPGPRGPGPMMYGPPGQRQGPGPGPGPRPHPSPRPQMPAANEERPGSRGGRGPPPSHSPRLPPPQAGPVSRDAVRGRVGGGGGSQGGNMNMNMNLQQRRDGSQPREAPPPGPRPRPQRPQVLTTQRSTTNKEDRFLGATATGPATKAPPRSPLFQHMNPFDVHSDEENEDDDKEEEEKEASATNTISRTNTATSTATATTHVEDRRAPYGIPSPPLSHRQRPSDEQQQENEEDEEDDMSMPIIRTVEAKRDTMVVGGPGRTSLGLQIEEFERTLQQAQAMSALENKADILARSGSSSSSIVAVGTTTTTTMTITTRSRANSNNSSNYSEMSESPMTIEPPLVSPKVFPLSPRPMAPILRPTHRTGTPTADAGMITSSPMQMQRRPSLEARSERTFGSGSLVRRETDESSTTTTTTVAGERRRPTLLRQETDESFSTTVAGELRRWPALEERPESPAATTATVNAAAARPRPRIGAAAALRRPTLDEYTGKTSKLINASTPAALAAGRQVHRPSPDEYGPVRIKRTDSPFRSESSSVSFRMDSPILKAVRHGHGVGEQGSVDSGHGSSTSTTSNSVQTSRTNSPVPTSTGSYSVFSPPPQQSQPAAVGPSAAVKRLADFSSSSLNTSFLYQQQQQQQQQPEWFGPAPTAPPTSPLPIPERSLRRKNTWEVGTSTTTSSPQTPLARSFTTPSASSPGLASSASIVPDIDANPNWPLPGPSTFVFPSPPPPPSVPQQRSAANASNNTVESGFAARRSTLQNKRTPPAPLNIAATKYADEVDGVDAGPWTPDAAVQQQQPTSPAFEDRRILPAATLLSRPSTAGVGAGGYNSGTDTAPAAAPPVAVAVAVAPSLNDFIFSNDDDDEDVHAEEEEVEDKSAAIGIARGLSIRYDHIREQERRGRGYGQGRGRTRERMTSQRQKQQQQTWRLDEEVVDEIPPTIISNPTSPTMTTTTTMKTTVVPFDRLRRPNHGLRSPTGIADEQGIRFI